MRKIILTGVIIVALVGGFTIYRTFFSDAAVSSVNIHLGEVDEKAARRFVRIKATATPGLCVWRMS